MNPDSQVLPDFPGTRTGCPFDPPPEHASWRDGEGVQKVRIPYGTAWVMTRWQDVRDALTKHNDKLSAMASRPNFPDGQDPDVPLSTMSATFPRLDDPEHARLRRMLMKDFTAGQAKAMRPEIQALVDRLLDQMSAKARPLDLLREFGYPVPSIVIAILLGAPYEDHEFFQKRSAALVDPAGTNEDRISADRDLLAYMMDLVEKKQRAPGDDLISRVLRDQVAHGHISHHDVAAMAYTLLFAGHETTAAMIGLSTLALLQNPRQLEMLRDTDDPALISSAVEELLRYVSIGQNVVQRVAIADFTIGGQLISAGDGVICALPAANRDPSFTPSPDTLDLTRKTRDHVAFGYGIHNCLGQNLSRVELQVALPSLLRRFPNLKLATEFAAVPFRWGTPFLGIDELIVTW